MPLQATAVNLVDGIVVPMGSQINPPQEALAQQNSQWRKLRAAEKWSYLIPSTYISKIVGKKLIPQITHKCQHWETF